MSSILKDTYEVSDADRAYIKNMARTLSLTTFQALNKYLNEYGICLSISTIEEIEYERKES